MSASPLASPLRRRAPPRAPARRSPVLLNQFLLLGAVLFSIGVYGVLARRNGVLVLMSIELILNAVNINLIAFGAQHRHRRRARSSPCSSSPSPPPRSASAWRSCCSCTATARASTSTRSTR